MAGLDGQGRLMLFDMAREGAAGDLRGYLQEGWVTNQRLQDLQALDLAGQPAAVGFGQVAVAGQPAGAMFAAVRGPEGRVLRFIYARSGGLTRADVGAFERSLRSFRPLAAAEAARCEPARIEVVSVRAGDTVDSSRGGWRSTRTRAACSCCSTGSTAGGAQAGRPGQAGPAGLSGSGSWRLASRMTCS